MANQTVILSAPSGYTGTMVMRALPEYTDTVTQDVEPTNGTNDGTLWSGVFVSLPLARYRFVLLEDGVEVAADFCDITADPGTFPCEGLTPVVAASLGTTAKSEVNAEMVDVLTVDTYAELAAVPAATSSLKDKLTYLFMWLRNKATQDSGERIMYADDGTTPVATSTTTDDGTTYTKGEDA